MRLAGGAGGASPAPPELRAFGAGARLDSAERRGFSGTLDFKWPLGSCIRVMFQQPSFADHGLARAAVAVVEQVARSWLPGAKLQLAFERERFFPRPPFPPDPFRYDVLVSLDDLPAFLPEKLGQPSDQIVAMPSSMLGTYALRMDYGDPTVYLGAYPLDGSPLSPRQRAAFFESAQFRGGVLHEFGHVLGLAHEHQNPRRYPPGRPDLWPPWAPAREIALAIERRWGVAVDESFVRAEISEPWPCLRDAAGAPLHSDWREPRGGWDFDSVMIVPGVREFFGGPWRQDDDPMYWLARHGAPTAADLQALREMYPGAP
jgi:hypothetical protein